MSFGPNEAVPIISTVIPRAKYRVFISYSRDDLELVEHIVAILKDNGLTPIWDQNFADGEGFHQQIQRSIAHAHVFLPVITDIADQHRWVHQEIGYAMALNVPILPMVESEGPGAMIREIQAIKIGSDSETLRQKLSWGAIDQLVQKDSGTTALFQCAAYAEDRAAMMASYARHVFKLGFQGRVRQKGALSSFHIPDKNPSHPIWKTRYGGLARGLKHCELQAEERVALEKHARTAGCKIIINPHIAYEKYGDAARIVRLECLLKFLESMPDDLCQVAINDQMDHSQSVTIVGDWFAAESVSAQIGEGYRQTIFTRHAASIVRTIRAFDMEFDDWLEASGWPAETSRQHAIELIEGIVDSLRTTAKQAPQPC